jgi:hypothetical protein
MAAQSPYKRDGSVVGAESAHPYVVVVSHEVHDNMRGVVGAFAYMPDDAITIRHVLIGGVKGVRLVG